MRTLDRTILSLAVPALGALIAEPVFIAIDTAMVGHLGAIPLAGLSVASAVLHTAVGIMIFLAYATTPLVARRLGAGNPRGAVQAGIDGLSLAAGVGVGLSALLALAGRWAVGLFGLEVAATHEATTYLMISLLGLPAMLVVFAATGLLRGLQNLTTPLWIAGGGFAGNAVLNAVFIYGFGLGIAGSAIGTVLAQWGMVAVYLRVIHGYVRREGAHWRLDPSGLRHASVSSGWLLLRSIGLRASLLVTLAAATAHGTVAAASFHIVMTLLSLAAFALDALAVAAQTLIGNALGAADAARAHAVVRRCLALGLMASGVIGGLIAGTAWISGRAFTTDPQVLSALPWALVALGALLPIGAAVYVLDGVLMGAGDMRYLGWTSLVNLACYAPCIGWVWMRADEHSAMLHTLLLTVSWGGVLMLTRLLTLGLRTVRGRWVVLGEA